MYVVCAVVKPARSADWLTGVEGVFRGVIKSESPAGWRRNGVGVFKGVVKLERSADWRKDGVGVFRGVIESERSAGWLKGGVGVAGAGSRVTCAGPFSAPLTRPLHSRCAPARSYFAEARRGLPCSSARGRTAWPACSPRVSESTPRSGFSRGWVGTAGLLGSPLSSRARSD